MPVTVVFRHNKEEKMGRTEIRYVLSSIAFAPEVRLPTDHGSAPSHITERNA